MVTPNDALQPDLAQKLVSLDVQGAPPAAPQVPPQTAAGPYIPPVLTSLLLVFVGSKNTSRGGSGFQSARLGDQ